MNQLESSNDDSNLNRRTCDPFAEKEVPIELGRIIIVGGDSEGTIYLVEEDKEEE